MRTPKQTLAALDEIAARAEAAPGRPWYTITNGFGDGDLHILSSQYDDAVLMSVGGDIPEEHRDAAARFVVGAIEDAPDLVALARTLQGLARRLLVERDEARSNYAFMVERADLDQHYATRADAAENERDELRGRLQQALAILSALAFGTQGGQRCWCGYVNTAHTAACSGARAFSAEEVKRMAMTRVQETKS